MHRRGRYGRLSGGDRKGPLCYLRRGAWRILQRAEDNGFVHQITNIDGENKIFAICNCQCSICNALRTSQLFNTPNMSRSAYVAQREKGKLRGLRTLRGVLPGGRTPGWGRSCAQKDGTEVKYPKQQLPDAVKWGKDKWDPDYRDNNRINSHEYRHGPLQDGLPGTHRRAGLLENGFPGQISRTRWRLSRRRIPSPPYADASATAAVRTPAPEAPWIRPSPSTK